MKLKITIATIATILSVGALGAGVAMLESVGAAMIVVGMTSALFFGTFYLIIDFSFGGWE